MPKDECYRAMIKALETCVLLTEAPSPLLKTMLEILINEAEQADS